MGILTKLQETILKQIDHHILAALALGALFLSPSPSLAESGVLNFTTGVDYSSGKYGGPESTDILYIPFTGKYETDKWTLKLTVPYVTITGPGNVVKDIGQTTPTAGTRTTQSGLGDVVAAATYELYDNGASGTRVDLTGKIKFGTADKDKGLGTGKDDYAFQADVYKAINKSFTAFGAIGYKIAGKPADYTLNNVFYGSLGGSYKLSQETSAGLILDLRQKSSATGTAQKELTAFLSHKISKDWKAQGYIVKGYTDSSPDWGAGIMMTHSF